jgi:hypothetical protein
MGQINEKGKEGSMRALQQASGYPLLGKKTMPNSRNELHEFRRFSDFLGSKNAQTNFEGIPKFEETENF